MRINICDDAYASRSSNENAQQTINYFPEVDKTGKNPIAMYGCPGTTTQHTLAAAAVVRAGFEYDSIAYWVSGNKFYSETTGGTVTERGTLTTSTGFVAICTDGLVILIVDGTDGYTYTISSTTFATIADVDFPANPIDCDILDNNFIVINGGAQTLHTSPDGTTWAALDFASAESAPDDLVSMIVDHQEIIFGGKDSTEVWYNSGETFTFSRRTVIETGVAGVGAMCKADNSVFFLGNDRVLWRLNGYTPVRVSTHAIEYAFNQFSTVSDCLMWAQKEEGHVFIWCQFPTGNQTWVYDVATAMWHRRAWRHPDTAVLHRHRANCYLYFNGEHLVGDYENGKVHKLSLDVYADNSDPLLAVRVFGPVTSKNSQEALRMNYLTVDMESGVGLASGQGSDPQLILKVSYDSGHTFETEVWQTVGIGPTGGYSTTTKFNRLGTIRYPQSAYFRLDITDPVKRVLIGGDLG